MIFIKKHFSNIIFGLFIILMIANPFNVRMKVYSTLIKLTSFSPSTVNESNRISLRSYDWNLENQSGEMLDFNDLKGKVIIVNYWATWCPPCVAEMPSIQKLYDDYGDKIEFVIVASDTRKKVTPFLKDHNYTMPIYYEISASLAEFQTSSIPATYLISKKGEIVISKKGAADWNSSTTRKIIDDLL